MDVVREQYRTLQYLVQNPFSHMTVSSLEEFLRGFATFGMLV
jgi:hypothetical protein